MAVFANFKVSSSNFFLDTYKRAMNDLNKGVFCISIDLELLWGRKDLNHENFIWQVKKERAIINKLLEIFKKYKIPATWAVVGKLFKYPSLTDKSSFLWSGMDILDQFRKN